MRITFDTGDASRVAFALLLPFAALLAGCALGPDFVRPTLPSDERYSSDPSSTGTVAADGAAQRFDSNAALPLDWWRLFGSTALDSIVAQALARSPTLQQAEASLRQSEDALSAGDGIFYPRFDAAASAERARTAPIQQGSQAPGSVFNVVTGSGTIAYPLDLFGGEHRAVESLSAQTDRQRQIVRAAYLALSADIVNTCIARAAYSAQVAATAELLGLERDQLVSAEIQSRSGTAPYANVLVQRSLIASTEASLAALRQRADQAGHLLALLQGLSPQQATASEVELTAIGLPAKLPVSLPSALVRQRPDILAAEAQLHSASADIGVATAAMFPSFSLNAAYGSAGSNLGTLGAASGTFWSVVPSIAAPLFHGGSLRAQQLAAIDAFDARQADYRQAVLVAFSQVADALKALEHDAQIVAAESDARNAAAEALAILNSSYRSGMIDYLEVLAADVQLHQATIAHFQATGQRLQDTVTLFVALGGGWDNVRPTGSADDGDNAP